MIIKKAWYKCKKCKENYFFEVDKPFSSNCPVCGEEMEFKGNHDCDTDLAEQVKNTPPYDPTKDPHSPYYISVVRCPYCNGVDVYKIGVVSRSVSAALFGLGSKKIGKQWHCNKCKSDF